MFDCTCNTQNSLLLNQHNGDDAPQDQFSSLANGSIVGPATQAGRRGHLPAEVGVKLQSSMQCSNDHTAIVGGESKQAPTNTYMNFTLNDLHDT